MSASAISHGPDADRDALPIDALIEDARAAERLGQFALARQQYENALRSLHRSNSTHLASALLRWIGNTHRNEGDGEAALDCFTASIASAEQCGDPGSVARALNAVGIIHWQWGQLDRADEYYADALRLAETHGEPRDVAMIRINQGVVANVRGDLHAARDHYRLGIQLYQELGEDQYLANPLSNLGMLHSDLGEWEEAEAAFTEAAEIAERVADSTARVMVEVNRTELFILKGDLAAARDTCDSAFELASRVENHLALGEVYKNYGIIYRETRKFNLSEAHLRMATEIAERFSSPLLVAEAQRELAEVYRIQDRNRDALLALNYAHRIFSELRAELDLADTDRRMHDLEGVFLEVVRTWGESIESKDRYTAGHCERVADYGCMLARAIGFDEQTLVWFRMGAFLHDVGKMNLPAELLNKQGPLSDDEWARMKRHTIEGVELLSPIDFPWDIRPMVRSHHERWDGLGYPDGLKARAIPLAARILCVADVFDALTTTRSYRSAYSPCEAIEIMRKDSGHIFDPELFALFEATIGPQLEAMRPAAEEAG